MKSNNIIVLETLGHDKELILENENLEDVRGIQLSNAMKNMDVGE